MAYEAMQALRATPDDAAARADVRRACATISAMRLLLKRYTPTVVDATPAQIAAAAWDTVPPVPPLFWSFRVMVGLGFYFIALFGDDVLAGLAPPAGAPALAAAGLPVVAAAALDRGGTRLGAWPRSGASHGRSTACCRPSCRSPACRPANVWISLAGFVAVLLGAGRGRGVPDGAHHPARTGRWRRRAGRDRRAAAPHAAE